ncbi:MAG: GH77, partial [uncultured Phycisphaerae bacterium]
MPRKQRQTPQFTFDRRSSGLILHPTSLPGPFGSGDLGREAYAFADFLAAAGQRWWQMLPVGPPGEGNSPYSAP